MCASSLKGPSYEQGTRLQAASGLHHLIGNHWHVLVSYPTPLDTHFPVALALTLMMGASHIQSETLDKNFEKPLRQHLDTYRTIVNVRNKPLPSLFRLQRELTCRSGRRRNGLLRTRRLYARKAI